MFQGKRSQLQQLKNRAVIYLFRVQTLHTVSRQQCKATSELLEEAKSSASQGQLRVFPGKQRTEVAPDQQGTPRDRHTHLQHLSSESGWTLSKSTCKLQAGPVSPTPRRKVAYSITTNAKVCGEVGWQRRRQAEE